MCCGKDKIGAKVITLASHFPIFQDNENCKLMSVVCKKVMFGTCSPVSRLQLPITIASSSAFYYKK